MRGAPRGLIPAFGYSRKKGARPLFFGSMMAGRRGRSAWLAASVLTMWGCTNVGLYSPDDDPNLANKLTISADLCTDDPGQRSFPMRVVFAVDASSTLSSVDPGAARVDALEDILGRFSATKNYEFAIVRFGEGARDVTGGFTRDTGALEGAVSGLRVTDSGSGRDVAGAIQATENLIDEVLLSEPPGRVTRTSFTVVLFASELPLPGDVGAGAAVAEQVRRLRAHVLGMNAASFRLHTVLLQPEDAVRAPRAENVYKEIALAGTGEFVGARQAHDISFSTLDLTGGTTRFTKKQIMVLNRNAITTPEGIAVDSDGDGLSDEVEIEKGLDPLSRDTDGDGLGDLVEMLHRAGGQRPSEPDTPAACEALDDPSYDTDYDGLTDCEERVLGTDISLFDSDKPPDGIPDSVELLCGTNPMADDTYRDYDFDGTPNGDECRVHTDPRGDDGESRWSLAYRYQEYEQGLRVVPVSSQPRDITGVSVIAVSPGSTPGVGSLRWTPTPDDDSRRGFLTWTDAAAVASGGEVDVLDGGPVELTLTSEEQAVHWIRLEVTPRLLPPRDGRDVIAIGSSERNCFSFRVKNVTLVETEDVDGKGRGWNDIYVYFAQVPEDVPTSPGLFRVAKLKARFLEDRPELRIPLTPEVVLEDGNFVLFGD